MDKENFDTNPEYAFHYEQIRHTHSSKRRQGYLFLVCSVGLLALAISGISYLLQKPAILPSLLLVVSNSYQVCGQTMTTAVPTALRQSSQSVFLSYPDRLSSQVMPVARDASWNIPSPGPVAAPPPCVRAHLPAGLACQSLSGCPSGKLLPRHL